MESSQGGVMTFSVLVKQDADGYVAHCLELDIVVTADSFEQAQADMNDLIAAQVTYAFENDNLAFLYHPAPKKVWEAFYRCQEAAEEEVPLVGSFAGADRSPGFVPPWIIAKTCRLDDSRRA